MPFNFFARREGGSLLFFPSDHIADDLAGLLPEGLSYGGEWLPERYEGLADGLSQSLVEGLGVCAGIGLADDSQSSGYDADFYLALCLHGVAVAVYHPCPLAHDAQTAGLEHADVLGAVLKLTAEQSVGHGGGLGHGEGLDDGDVHQSVGHGGVGGDVGVVAILGGVGQGDGESFNGLTIDD